MAALNKRLLQPGERIRVLVVDDSVVIRHLVAHGLIDKLLVIHAAHIDEINNNDSTHIS